MNTLLEVQAFPLEFVRGIGQLVILAGLIEYGTELHLAEQRLGLLRD